MVFEWFPKIIFKVMFKASLNFEAALVWWRAACADWPWPKIPCQAFLTRHTNSRIPRSTSSKAMAVKISSLLLGWVEIAQKRWILSRQNPLLSNTLGFLTLNVHAICEFGKRNPLHAALPQPAKHIAQEKTLPFWTWHPRETSEMGWIPQKSNWNDWDWWIPYSLDPEGL